MQIYFQLPILISRNFKKISCYRTANIVQKIFKRIEIFSVMNFSKPWDQIPVFGSFCHGFRKREKILSSRFVSKLWRERWIAASIGDLCLTGNCQPLCCFSSRFFSICWLFGMNWIFCYPLHQLVGGARHPVITNTILKYIKYRWNHVKRSARETQWPTHMHVVC